MQVKFKLLTAEYLALVLSWRTREDITRWLFTDVSLNIDLHWQWFMRLQQDPKQAFWVVFVNDIPMGVLFLKDINRKKGTAEIGYYFADHQFKGIASLVPAMFYQWAFHNGFKKITLFIFADHDRLFKLHTLHGFRIVQAIAKYAKGRSVLKMEMRKQDYKGFKIMPAEVETCAKLP